MDNAEKEPRPPHIKRRTYLIAVAVGAGAVLGAYQLSQSPLPEGTPAPASSPEKSRQQPEFASSPSWEQNFLQMTNLDTSVWRYESDPKVPGYNEEEQAYVANPQNVRVEPGVGLVIEAHKQQYRYPNDSMAENFEYTSGRIDTLNGFNFTYGKLEARMKLPAGTGTWPAFWLLSANQIHADESNISSGTDERYYMKNGEIDIMEYYGHTPSKIEGTVHTYAASDSGSAPVYDAPYVFHTYGIEISPSKIVWTLDGKPYHSFEKPSDNPDEWPFTEKNELYIILNLAMGGTGGGPIDTAAQSWRMEVQNLSFYDYISQ